MPEEETWRVPVRVVRMYMVLAIVMFVLSVVLAVVLGMFLPLGNAGKALPCPAYWVAGKAGVLILVQIVIIYRSLGKFFSTVTIDKDGIVVFRSVVRTRRVRPSELMSISGVAVKEGDLVVAYQGGIAEFPSLLERRDELVERLKVLNPAVKIERF